MHLAQFCHRYPPALGGAEAYSARLSRFLIEQGDEVTVFTSTAIDLTAFWSWQGRCLPAGIDRQEGVEVRRYRLWRWPGRRWLLKPLSLVPIRPWQCLTFPWNPICPGMWREAGRSTTRFDAVHATAWPFGWPLLCGWRLAQRWRIPFLVTPFLHLGDPDNPRDAIRQVYLSPPLVWLLQQADAIFVQTPREQAALVERGFPADRIHLQGLGVEPAECTGGERRRTRELWGTADRPVIGHLANNSIEKGTVDLLQAAAQLWERGLDFHVVLAGPEMPSFQRFWRGYSHAGRVIRLGPLTDQQKRDFFAGIDLFALPSRSDSFGLVLLEAWANRLPNVAYRAGGVADVIRHDQDGLLVRCGDTGELAGALELLLRSPERRQRLGQAGWERLAVEFRWRDKLQLVREVMLTVGTG